MRQHLIYTIANGVRNMLPWILDPSVDQQTKGAGEGHQPEYSNKDDGADSPAQSVRRKVAIPDCGDRNNAVPDAVPCG